MYLSQFSSDTSIDIYLKQRGAEIDEIIRKAITKVLGREWEIEEIDSFKDRLSLLDNGETKLFFLDGAQILQLWNKTEFERVVEDGLYKLIASRKYRFFD